MKTGRADARACPGRAESSICVDLRSFAVDFRRSETSEGLKTAIWTTNGRKGTQMGTGNSLGRGFLAGKQEWGGKTGGGTVRNYEKREKREKWVGKCENRQPHAEAWTTYGLST